MMLRRKELIEFLADRISIDPEVNELGSVYFGIEGDGRRNGWLHKVYSPLPKEFFVRKGFVESLLKGFSYGQHLEVANGIHLFCGAIVLFGVHFQPTLTEAIVDIKLENEEGNNFEDGEALLFGALEFEEDEYWCFERSDGTIIAVDRETGCIGEGWSDLENFLTSEIARISVFFDLHGNQTSPILGFS